ncbi:MAG: hypothetical protein J3K34DRAFT_390608 [Monoraphidium minutum]|nr:MAG: hypothetical protein J3K34DRAFT_390608 [Monoraphidium minutum]
MTAPRRARAAAPLLALLAALAAAGPRRAAGEAFPCQGAVAVNSACGATFAAAAGPGSFVPEGACAPCGPAGCSCPPSDCISVVSACREGTSNLANVRVGFGGCKYTRTGAGARDTRISWVAFQGVDTRAKFHVNHAWMRDFTNGLPGTSKCSNTAGGTPSTCCLQLNVQGAAAGRGHKINNHIYICMSIVVQCSLWFNAQSRVRRGWRVVYNTSTPHLYSASSNGQINRFKMACGSRSVIWMGDASFSSCNSDATVAPSDVPPPPLSLFAAAPPPPPPLTLPEYLFQGSDGGKSFCGAPGAAPATQARGSGCGRRGAGRVCGPYTLPPIKCGDLPQC